MISLESYSFWRYGSSLKKLMLVIFVCRVIWILKIILYQKISWSYLLLEGISHETVFYSVIQLFRYVMNILTSSPLLVTVAISFEISPHIFDLDSLRKVWISPRKKLTQTCLKLMKKPLTCITLRSHISGFRIKILHVDV